MTTKPMSATTRKAIDQVEQYGAHNYAPLPVVIARAEGARVTDVDGRTYIDCLAAYSAVNFGHSNPRLLAAARRGMVRRGVWACRAMLQDPPPLVNTSRRSGAVGRAISPGLLRVFRRFAR